MRIDFIFVDYIKWLIDTDKMAYSGPLCEVKGISVGNFALVNLSADQWKDYTYIQEYILIEELCKTIAHETLHTIIRNLFNEHLSDEKAVVSMSGQVQSLDKD